EALARAGARVTAADLAPELVKVARLHMLESGVQVEYLVQAVEALAEERPGSFDAVTCMEMLEHVPDPGAIIQACARLLRQGGRLFLSTLNRTPAAFALAIVGAEYVAGLLPKGTHRYADFIRPSELAAWLRAAGLQLEDVSGLFYDPLRHRARLSRRTEVNYLACAVKPSPPAGSSQTEGQRGDDGGIPAGGTVRPGRHPARQRTGHGRHRQPHARRPRPAAGGCGGAAPACVQGRAGDGGRHLPRARWPRPRRPGAGIPAGLSRGAGLPQRSVRPHPRHARRAGG